MGFLKKAEKVLSWSIIIVRKILKYQMKGIFILLYIALDIFSNKLDFRWNSQCHYHLIPPYLKKIDLFRFLKSNNILEQFYDKKTMGTILRFSKSILPILIIGTVKEQTYNLPSSCCNNCHQDVPPPPFSMDRSGCLTTLFCYLRN